MLLICFFMFPTRRAASAFFWVRAIIARSSDSATAACNSVNTVRGCRTHGEAFLHAGQSEAHQIGFDEIADGFEVIGGFHQVDELPGALPVRRVWLI